jgi:hypothetical protein
LRKPRNRKLWRFWLLIPMKVSSTPANSPAATFAFVGSRQSAPTCCQSASVGEPMLTPGICRICVRRSLCASTRVEGQPSAPNAEAAPTPAVPSRKRRRVGLPNKRS